MATRDYQFIVGPETSTLPTATDPSVSSDIVSLGYANKTYTRGISNLAALQALGTADRTDNQTVYVDTLQSFFYFDSASALTADSVQVIQPTVGTGRWLKVLRPMLTFSSSANFVTFKGVAAAAGDIFFNTTTNVINEYNGTSWLEVLDTTSTQTVSGKTFAQAILPEANNTRDIGSSGTRFRTGYFGTDLNVTGQATLGSAIISGDLTVQGSTTTLDTTNTNIKDALITINKGGTIPSSEGSGIEIDRAAGTFAKIIYANAATSRFKCGDTGSEIEIATISASQVITNKDIDGGTASNTSRITLPKAAFATLNGLTRKEATIVYASDTDKVYADNGTSLVELGTTTGTVTSVTFTGDGTVLSSTPSSAVTTTGTLNASLNTQTARTFLQGPQGGAAAAPTFAALQVPTRQIFTSSSGTYTTPSSPAPLYLRVRMAGGGGGGSGSGTTSGTLGSAGGNSTFGSSLLTANGGGAAGTNQGGLAGSGGTVTVSGPALTMGSFPGGDGAGGGFSAGATYSEAGGLGGSGVFGGAGKSGTGGTAGGAGRTNTGAGGGGGAGSTTLNVSAGHGGGAGGCIDAIISSPSASYSYAVGAAGTAGTAGTSGVAGGDGAAGIIIVEEHYQ